MNELYDFINTLLQKVFFLFVCVIISFTSFIQCISLFTSCLSLPFLFTFFFFLLCVFCWFPLFPTPSFAPPPVMPSSFPLCISSLAFSGAEVVVEYDYDALHDDELTLRLGDVIKNVRYIEEDGWMEGELHGKRGLFPDNFVKVRKKMFDNGTLILARHILSVEDLITTRVIKETLTLHWLRELNRRYDPYYHTYFLCTHLTEAELHECQPVLSWQVVHEYQNDLSKYFSPEMKLKHTVYNYELMLTMLI